jgi:hypothetical protein
MRNEEDEDDAVKFLLSHEVKSITGTVMAEDAGSTV